MLVFLTMCITMHGAENVKFTLYTYVETYTKRNSYSHNIITKIRVLHCHGGGYEDMKPGHRLY